MNTRKYHYTNKRIIYICLPALAMIFFAIAVFPQNANAQFVAGCTWQVNSSARYGEWTNICPLNVGGKDRICTLALLNALNKYPNSKCLAPCGLYIKESHYPSCSYWNNQQQQAFFDILRRAVPGFNDAALRWQPGENYFAACSISMSLRCDIQNPGIGWKGPIP